MLQRGFFLAAVLSVASLCMTPALAPAGKGGGHGGGGGHAGGGHAGGGHMGGGHMGAHPGSGHMSGNHHSNGVFFGSPFYGGFYGGGFYPYGFGYGGLYGFGGGYGSGYGYGGYSSPLYYGNRYSYYPYPDGITQLPPAPQKYASIRVILPDGAAKVWFDGNDTKQTGNDRWFYTPDLEPGAGPYSYRIRASWKADGQDMVQERVVEVAPGQTSIADFR